MPANWTVLRVMPRVKNPHTNYGLRLSAIFDWYRVLPSYCVDIPSVVLLKVRTDYELYVLVLVLIRVLPVVQVLVRVLVLVLLVLLCVGTYYVLVRTSTSTLGYRTLC